MSGYSVIIKYKKTKGGEVPVNVEDRVAKNIEEGRGFRLFDDDKSNLQALLSLKDDYNDIEFEAWLANDKGQIKKVK